MEVVVVYLRRSCRRRMKLMLCLFEIAFCVAYQALPNAIMAFPPMHNRLVGIRNIDAGFRPHPSLLLLMPVYSLLSVVVVVVMVKCWW